MMVTDGVLCEVGTEVLYASHGSVRYASYGCKRCRIFLSFTVKFIYIHIYTSPIRVAARSKAWVCGRSLSGIVGSNPPRAWMSVSSECCVLSVWSLVQKSPIECGASECDCEA
jgi:hypothetical protein